MLLLLAVDPALPVDLRAGCLPAESIRLAIQLRNESANSAPLILHGRSFGHTAHTRSLRSSPIASIGNSIPNVCTPDDGRIQRPASDSSPLRPSNPISRVKHVSATAILVPITVARVTFRIVTCAIWIIRRFLSLQRFGSLPTFNYADFFFLRTTRMPRTTTKAMAATTRTIKDISIEFSSFLQVILRTPQYCPIPGDAGR